MSSKISGSEALGEPELSRFAFTLEQTRQYQEQTRKYFQSRPRPRSLYQHTFTEDSFQARSENNQHFQKGNIQFRGNVEQRKLDAASFYEKLEQNTRPFVFEPPVPGTKPTNERKPVDKEIATPFAKFKGSVETRQFFNVDRRSPVASAVRGFSRQAPSTQQLVVPTEVAQDEQHSSRGTDAASAKSVVVKQQEVAPDTTTTPVAPAENQISVEPIQITSSTRQIASAAPVSLSRRHSAVADVVQAPPQVNSASSSPPSKLGRQHPRTTAAGSQKHRDSTSGGDSNPAGCAVQ